MADDERDEYAEKHWPVLLIGCCLLILWYTLGDNGFAGAAGFLGLGWLAWMRLIKPKL
ncbi:MAG: hypothetical protein AAGD13_17625 [Pseudomonadota bacterium]